MSIPTNFRLTEPVSSRKTMVIALCLIFSLTMVCAWNMDAIDTLYLNNASLQLSFVANGTGTNNGIYQAGVDASDSNAPYGTYFYCNMPHPRVTEYELPTQITSGQVTGKLVYLEYLQRHHKRTCYNILLGGENQRYNCSNVQIFEYGRTPGVSPVQVYAQSYVNPNNPFVLDHVNGTCRFPQITRGGLLDSVVHGKDLWSVYGEMLKFLPSEPDSTIFFRTSQSELTEVTAGGVIHGLYPDSNKPIPIHQQRMDTINKGFPCSIINQIQTSYMATPEWKAHLAAAAPLLTKLNPMLGTTENSAWISTYLQT